MDYDRYCVKAFRVIRDWFKPERMKTFYVPLYEGKAFVDDTEYPCVWGFETEEDAWKACKKHFDGRFFPE